MPARWMSHVLLLALAVMAGGCIVVKHHHYHHRRGPRDGRPGQHRPGHPGHSGHHRHHRAHGGAGEHGHASAHADHRFRDAEHWSHVFDDPARDEWQQPDHVVTALALKGDEKVADVGAGTGYFAVRLARAASKGQVLGIDVEPDMVRFIDQRAKKDSLSNLSGRLAAMDDPRLDDGTDLVLIVDTYHHLDDRPEYLKKMRSKLSGRGRVAVVDFRPQSELGPPEEMKLASETVKEEFASAGYKLAVEHDFLKEQYFLVFEPQR